MAQTKVDLLAHAIALAEGFYAGDSLPYRIHNPGDLELGDRGWGTDANKTVYPKADPDADISDWTDGYSALRREIHAIFAGASRVYTTADTFGQLAAKWTGGDNPGAWCKIVTDNLGVSPFDKLGDWYNEQQLW